MDFLNVGPWELVLVLIITILVAGPKRMVEIARTLGRVSRELRDMSREFTTALQAEIEAAEAEAGEAGTDLRQVRKELEETLSDTAAVTRAVATGKADSSPRAESGAEGPEPAPPTSEGEGQPPPAEPRAEDK